MQYHMVRASLRITNVHTVSGEFSEERAGPLSRAMEGLAFKKDLETAL